MNSAKKERSIGIGVLGFHSFLQQKNIPFESDEAAKINIDIFTKLRSEIDTFNLFLDLLEDLQKMPRVLDADFVIQWLLLRQQLLLLLWEIHHQVVEPFRANTYRQDTLSGSFLNINKIYCVYFLKG